jgi:hypothetical protein
VSLHEVEQTLPDVVVGKVGPRSRVDGIDVAAASADAVKEGGEAVAATGGAGEEMLGD